MGYVKGSGLGQNQRGMANPLAVSPLLVPTHFPVLQMLLLTWNQNTADLHQQKNH